MKLLTLRALLAAALFSAVLIAPFLPAVRNRDRLALQVEMTSSAVGRVQVFYGDGSGFTEAMSASASIDTVDTPVVLSLAIPPGHFRELRLDPLDAPGRVVISAMRVTLGRETMRALPVRELIPLQEVASVRELDGGVEVVVESGKADPKLGLGLSQPLTVAPPWRRLIEGFWPRALPVFIGSVALLGLLDRARIRPSPAFVPGVRTFRHGLAAFVFLLIFGGKLAVIDRFGSDLPYWDQWWKEGIQTFIPWLERGELWPNLFSPMNEHRVAPTVALNLLLLELGGQWDARVQCVINAALHATMMAGLLLLASRRLSARWTIALATVMTLLAALPIAWENIIGGFQSQFYFLILFSFFAMAGLLGSPAFSLRWCGGLLAGMAALVSMGSGFFWAAAVMAIAFLRLIRRDGSARDGVALLVVGALFTAAGIWLRTMPSSLEFLHARTAGEFATYAARCLAWPFPALPALAAVIWLPWVGLLAVRAHSPEGIDSKVADLVLAVGGWVLLHALAVAYARGGSGGLPPSRYGDVFGLGPLVGVAALALLGARWRFVPAVGAAFVGLVAAGAVLNAINAMMRPLPMRSAEYAAFERSVRDFVLSDDYPTFARRPLPFPAADELARALHHPLLRQILPSSVREPRPISDLGGAQGAGPALSPRRTRTVTAPGGWQSKPLPSGAGWWKIETAGAIGEPGVSLDLVGAEGGRRLARIAPTKPAGAAWRAAYVRAPTNPAILVARAERPGSWLAFSEPVEIPALSYWLWRAAKHGLLMACITAAGGIVLAWLANAAGRYETAERERGRKTGTIRGESGPPD